MIFFMFSPDGVIFFVFPDYSLVPQQSSVSNVDKIIFRLFNAPVDVLFLPKLISKAMRSNNGFDFFEIF